LLARLRLFAVRAAFSRAVSNSEIAAFWQVRDDSEGTCYVAGPLRAVCQFLNIEDDDLARLVARHRRLPA
jgi:hypothetical protein